jgi:hypothetical protein
MSVKKLKEQLGNPIEADISLFTQREQQNDTANCDETAS